MCMCMWLVLKVFAVFVCTFVFVFVVLTGISFAFAVACALGDRHDVKYRVTPSIVIGNVSQPHVELYVVSGNNVLPPPYSTHALHERLPNGL